MRDIIQALWPVSTTAEFAPELAFGVAALRGDWWREWQQEEPLALDLPTQWHGMCFLRWLEAEKPAGELMEMLELACYRVAPRVTEELHAAYECVGRDYTPVPDLSEEPTLAGEKVRLWAPAPCAGYPRRTTSHLDEWTREALDGADVKWQSAPAAQLSDLAWVHSRSHVQAIMKLAERGGGQLTPETWVTPDAPDATLAACGAMIDAVRCAVGGDDRVPLCLIRPGSHHAERARSGGTCLVNNLAVAAVWALRNGARRVAILDLDAHHGNGTEDCFRESDKVLTVSVHQDRPFFPGTGGRSDRGAGVGRGFNLNLPVPAHSTADDWAQAALVGVERIARFRPDLILVEFSTDAHRSDPVSDLAADDEAFEVAVAALESIGVPVIYELGASLSRRAWRGGLRALVRAAAACR